MKGGMQMNIFKKPLAMIEFNFLERLQSEGGWNTHFFEIFQWLDEVEDELLYHNQLKVILLNDDQIFFKKRGEKKIGIYQNFLNLKPEASKQLIVTCSKKEISNQIKNQITTFVESLLKFLEDRKIKNQVLPKSCIPQLNDSLAVEQMVEVLIGIS